MQVGEEGGEVVGVGDEDGVGGAGEAGEDGGAEVLRGVRRWRCWGGDGVSWGGGWGDWREDERAYIDWADEVFVPHQDVGHAEAEDDG